MSNTLKKLLFKYNILPSNISGVKIIAKTTFDVQITHSYITKPSYMILQNRNYKYYESTDLLKDLDFFKDNDIEINHTDMTISLSKNDVIDINKLSIFEIIKLKQKEEIINIKQIEKNI